MFNIFSKKEQIDKKGSKLGGAWGDGQAVLSAIDDGVIAIDPSGNIRIINPAAEKMIGWTSGDSQDLAFESVFVLADREGKVFERAENPIRLALFDFNNFSSDELFLKTGSGKAVPISLRINPIDENNSGLVVVFRNIAKELEESRQQTEFISTASHEMRTPVASIEGYLGLALNPATATIDDRARGFLEKAHENTKHLGQLFQDLLDITRSEDGRLKSEPVVLDAVEFSRNIWEGLKTKAEEKGLNYIFELDSNKTGEKTLSPVYYIHSDRDHLHEVLDNLFENAIKYTPSGKISVNVSGDNDFVRISVQDSGIGIPAEDIPHLFQKFYRVDNSETREIGGTGLGLYLSRRLVESMGGKLKLESEYKKGSTFIVELPRLTREQAEKFKSQEAEKAKEENSKKDEIFESTKDVAELNQESVVIPEVAETSPVQQPQEQVPTTQIDQPQVQQNYDNQVQQQAQYYQQEQALRQYQIQQYYARQKAAEDARIRAEQANLARMQQSIYQQVQAPQPNQVQNPYFPQDQQISSASQFPQSQQPNHQPSQSRSQAPAPTIADIERMREEYLQRIAAERQSRPN